MRERARLDNEFAQVGELSAFGERQELASPPRGAACVAHNGLLPRDGVHGIALLDSTFDSWSVLNPAD